MKENLNFGELGGNILELEALICNLQILEFVPKYNYF